MTSPVSPLRPIDAFTKDQIREAILERFHTFMEPSANDPTSDKFAWVGSSSDTATADSIIELFDYLYGPVSETS